MFNRLLFTIATVACLTGAYAMYAILSRSLVDVPELPTTSGEQVRHAIAHRPAENVRVAETHLSEQSWAARSEYMLHSGQSFIYTREFQHTAGDPRIRFIPFAMVWLQKNKQGVEEAVTLVSDSALIRFASGLDSANPNPGRVIGAVLDGDVQIKGPDGLEIVGKQFVFDESAPSLVSTNPVDFRYGSHQGWGRTLNMKLIPAEGPPGRDRPHVFGIRTVRLGSGPVSAEHVRLNIRPPQQQGQESEPQKPVTIQCRGDLEFDVAAQTATFSKSVRASRWTGKSDYDQLECDELWLQFEPAPNPVAMANMAAPEDSGKDTGAQPYQKIETDLVFRHLIATGQKVLVRSTQNNLRATMNRLEYDSPKRRLQLTGRVHATDPRNVFVSFKGSALTVPDVEVLLHEGTLLKEKEVLCRGAGRLERISPETNVATFVATWAGHLRKSTDSANGLDVIELQKQAYFSQLQQKTALGAETIRLWLAPLSLGIPAGAGDPSSQPPTSEPQPKRLVAERDVALVSPQLVARTSELEIRFEEGVPAPREIGLQRRDALQQVSLELPVPRTTDRRPLDPPIQPKPRTAVVPSQGKVQAASFAAAGLLGPPIDPLSADTASSVRARSTDPMLKSSEPLEVTADWIGVRMQRVEGEPQPELIDVETRGHFKIVRRSSAGEAPMTAEGDRLHLQNRGKDREIVHLFGQPAHLRVRDRGLHVEGREIHLDRAANRVQVNGKGLIQLPVPPGTAFESVGQATNDPDLDVWWQESMVFDGLTAKFIGKVRAELGFSRMHCGQMDVSLSSRLSFTDQEVEQQPELRTVRCREDVSFENSDYQDPDNKLLIRVQRGRVSEFTLDRLKGTSFAQGPGQMLVWQRGTGTQPGLVPRAAIQANRPISAVTADWDFTRVDFKGQMTGKIEPQLSTFRDSVLIVHGPVNRLSEMIDPDHLTPQAGSMRCENLEFAHHAKGPNQSNAYQQLVGWGNAQIEGRGFYANADSISFDGSKGMYMLWAHGNQSAMIAQDTDQGRRNEASGRRIEFIPATKTVKVDWANGATGSP